jgi:hypothetical protein
MFESFVNDYLGSNGDSVGGVLALRVNLAVFLLLTIRLSLTDTWISLERQCQIGLYISVFYSQFCSCYYALLTFLMAY